MIEHTLTFDFIFIFKSDLNIEHAKITVGFINTLGLTSIMAPTVGRLFF